MEGIFVGCRGAGILILIIQGGRVQGQGGSGSNSNMVVKKMEKLCNHWLQGNCKFGDNCKYLHQWSTGDCFSLLTPLEGHQQVVTGIALPMGLDKLYMGSQDDCQPGQVVGVVNVGGTAGFMLSKDPCEWNIQTSTDLSLNGPVGQVYSRVIGNDMLFAGTQDGTILAWKFIVATNCFEPAASLKGHTLAVVTLVVGANRLYSGSMDHSIRVWNLETSQCLQTLTGHTDVVMYVLCWDQFLLSSSLDKTIEVWVAIENGSLEATCAHIEEHVMGANEASAISRSIN
ncbi:zinc finger CCCH domain-containing protein 63-like [Olea europaea var. sylvestris]|uniref:zinc finger CCCH domain-containing protein 63-like n=1 Tax=Olea europaea var. sylvestris TaxID=158386 RepID=UPI000C1D5637|nr:zinc finger CCCH domain-containing protein 63-like [Olea europaea var. sylvestris]